jgi:hypothetical protein
MLYFKQTCHLKLTAFHNYIFLPDVAFVFPRYRATLLPLSPVQQATICRMASAFSEDFQRRLRLACFLLSLAWFTVSTVKHEP